MKGDPIATTKFYKDGTGRVVGGIHGEIFTWWIDPFTMVPPIVDPYGRNMNGQEFIDYVRTKRRDYSRLSIVQKRELFHD